MADTEKERQNSKWQFYSADCIGQPYHHSPGYCPGTLGCPADLHCYRHISVAGLRSVCQSGQKPDDWACDRRRADGTRRCYADHKLLVSSLESLMKIFHGVDMFMLMNAAIRFQNMVKRLMKGLLRSCNI